MTEPDGAVAHLSPGRVTLAPRLRPVSGSPPVSRLGIPPGHMTAAMLGRRSSTYRTIGHAPDDVFEMTV